MKSRRERKREKNARRAKKRAAKGNRKWGFYGLPEWRLLRLSVLERYGSKCQRCGSAKKIHVDHILPRSKFPELSLFEGNLQILCKRCNEWKGNHRFTDFRPKQRDPQTVM